MKRPRLINTDSLEDFPLGVGETTIGRNPGCKIVIKDRKASAHHASVTGDCAGQFVIRDLASTNGTFVNGAKIREVRLSADDSIRIGKVKFGFHIQEDQSALLRGPQSAGAGTIVTAGTARSVEGSLQSSAAMCAECGKAIAPGIQTCRNCGAPADQNSRVADVDPTGGVKCEKRAPKVAALATSSLAPPLSRTSKPQQQSGENSTESFPGHILSSASASVTPIWSPILIGLLFVPFGYLWSSAMVALNWHALRKHWLGMMTWLFAVAYLFCIHLPLFEVFPATFCYMPVPNLLGILVWFPVVGLTQLQYFRKRLRGQCPQRSWLLPISLGIALNVATLIWARYGQMDTADTASTPVVVQQEQDREYTAEDLNAAWAPFVAEVRVTWKETWGWVFTSDKCTAGSAVCFRYSPGALYFITNRHVVNAPPRAEQYSCRIHIGDSQEWTSVEVLAFGKNGLDLALLRVRVPELTETWEMPMASVKSVVVGQQCVAIGNALGYGRSATSGIVSRFDEIGDQIRIRTSAPISPGNSGGGLFSNKGGFLLGITTAILTGENAQNMNSVIPADYFAGDDAWDYLPGMSP